MDLPPVDIAMKQIGRQPSDRGCAYIARSISVAINLIGGRLTKTQIVAQMLPKEEDRTI
jgi:hypothetical protein